MQEWKHQFPPSASTDNEDSPLHCRATALTRRSAGPRDFLAPLFFLASTPACAHQLYGACGAVCVFPALLCCTTDCDCAGYARCIFGGVCFAPVDIVMITIDIYVALYFAYLLAALALKSMVRLQAVSAPSC